MAKHKLSNDRCVLCFDNKWWVQRAADRICVVLWKAATNGLFVVVHCTMKMRNHSSCLQTTSCSANLPQFFTILKLNWAKYEVNRFFNVVACVCTL